MGTELQSKMYLPGYYSLRDINDDTGNSSWSLHQQNDMFGQYHDFFLARPATDDEGHDREQLRQTILTHESVFRHQLHELHRLYRIQRDMMNEMRSKELHRHMMQGGTSQFSFCSSGMPVADDNAGHKTSDLFLNHGRLSVSGSESIQCEYRSMKENIMQSNYGSTQTGLRLKDCESSESGCKKLRRRLFDLERPADVYINDEEEGPGLSGVSVVESHLLSRKHGVTHDRDGNLSTHTGVNSGCNGDVLNGNMRVRNLQGWRNLNEPINHREASASGSTGVNSGCNGDMLNGNMRVRNLQGWRNLNEPINHREASASGSTGVLGNIICSKNEIDIRASNSHSSFQCLAKISQELQNGQEAGVSLGNLHLETDRRQKGWLAYNTEAGQSGSSGRSLSASFCPEDFPVTSKSQQTERRNSNEPVKKKLFGVEICERNHRASVEESHMLIPQSLVPQSNLENHESSSISSWDKLHSGISQDITRIQGNLSFSSFTPSNRSSLTLMESPEGTPSKLLVSSNLQSIPSISAEACSRDHLCHSSQLESKESWGCYSSNGFGHLNGISDSTYASEKLARDGPKNTCRDLGSVMVAKSSELKKADAVPPNGYQNDAQPAAVSANGPSKQSPQRGLPWLNAVPSCNGSFSEERHGSSQINLDSLRNSFQQPVDKTEMMRKSSFQNCVQDSSSATRALDAEHQRTGVSECASNRRILGCSIFEKPHISKNHLSPSTPSKPCYSTSAVDDTESLKVGPHDTKAPHEMSPKLEEQPEVEGQIEKGLIKFSADSGRHIDLNMSVIDDGLDEETQPTTRSSSRTNQKISVEIDLETPVVDETELDVAPGFEYSRSKLPPGFESFQSNHPLSESFQSNLPPGFESLQSKHPYCSESVQSNLPPGFESFQSKHPPGSKSVQSDLPPGFESFQSKHPPDSESFRIPPGFESFHREFPPGFEYFQCKFKKPIDTLQDESREPHEGLITVAAEALVTISSSRLPLQVDTFCHQSEASPGDPLLWFAEIISSYKGDIENEIALVSTGKDSIHEDILPNGMDYFEYMTLNLTEAKLEEISTYKPQSFENSKNENILFKRPRRGQARRGRQRKDFQRDVLPTLSSLLINEVTEDLQTIEGMIQATGGTWKSSLALKNTRNGGGRRKRRLPDSDSPPNATVTCPPPTQLPNCREVAIEDHTSFFDWGKRTRRPPRNRYPITNPPLTIK